MTWVEALVEAVMVIGDGLRGGDGRGISCSCRTRIRRGGGCAVRMRMRRKKAAAVGMRWGRRRQRRQARMEREKRRPLGSGYAKKDMQRLPGWRGGSGVLRRRWSHAHPCSSSLCRRTYSEKRLLEGSWTDFANQLILRPRIFIVKITVHILLMTWHIKFAWRVSHFTYLNCVLVPIYFKLSIIIYVCSFHFCSACNQ